MNPTGAEEEVPDVIQFRSLTAVRLRPGGEAGTGADQREHPRLGVELAVTLGSDSNFYLGLTENISEGGVFIATERVEPVGLLLEVAIALNDGLPPLRVVGELRWLRDCPPRGIGLRFRDISPVDTVRVRMFALRRDPVFFEE